MNDKQIIVFMGLHDLIDKDQVQRIATFQGREAHYFHWNDVPMAVRWVKEKNLKDYWLLGFSAGASGNVIKQFVDGLHHFRLPMPTEIKTVGLYYASPAYIPYLNDPIPHTNYLDWSGQRHAKEPDMVNFGKDVPHLGKGAGMQLLADLLTKV